MLVWSSTITISSILISYQFHFCYPAPSVSIRANMCQLLQSTQTYKLYHSTHHLLVTFTVDHNHYQSRRPLLTKTWPASVWTSCVASVNHPKPKSFPPTRHKTTTLIYWLAPHFPLAIHPNQWPIATKCWLS